MVYPPSLLIHLTICFVVFALVSGNEIRDDTFIEYGDVTVDYPYYFNHGPPVCAPGSLENHHGDTAEQGHTKLECLNPADFVLNDFIVAGVNLAGYRNDRRAIRAPRQYHLHQLHQQSRPFLLYQDFDIGYMLQGNETWMELIMIRRYLQRPALSFYSDKVSRKRWLAEHGYPQPHLFFAIYKDQLVPSTATQEDLAIAILPHIPTTHGFCAKPNHMSMTMGNWLVDIDPNQPQNPTKFSRVAKQLKADEVFDPKACADSLAHGLHREAATIESYALKQVRPGFVVEELYTNHLDRSMPPHEFCLFTIWGKVYVGQWNSVDVNDRYLDGFIYRDGSPAKGCDWKDIVPDWVPWDEMVVIAESLSTGKDLFRVDFLVGVPRYSLPDTKPHFVISESAIHPNTMFCNSFIADEMARLWVAGYKIGNYQVIANPEIPGDFLTKGALMA